MTTDVNTPDATTDTRTWQQRALDAWREQEAYEDRLRLERAAQDAEYLQMALDHFGIPAKATGPTIVLDGIEFSNCGDSRGRSLYARVKCNTPDCDQTISFYVGTLEMLGRVLAVEVPTVVCDNCHYKPASTTPQAEITLSNLREALSSILTQPQQEW